ncbi:hypothetical protein KW817_22225 [Enterobacter quasiroggenkampii]|uniref:hypothetical protein n=1 Tax=Enterobacter quasiroggenkampii TaxID=2497436 RepID=UPI0021D09E52|nr:hypothetical protein [Enterobacter quasiroggenkampii]MCU6405694.1 hypothetical protein [Enterobacter quasiroggenkampii]
MVFNLFKRKKCPVCEINEKVIAKQDELIKLQEKSRKEQLELYYSLCAISELICDDKVSKEAGLALLQKATKDCRPEVEGYKSNLERELWELRNEA